MLINRCVEEYLKETRRLNILKQSNIYENINSQKSNNVTPYRSSIIIDVNQLSQEHVDNGHKSRVNTHHPSNNNYYSKTRDDDRNDYIPLPLPPRRIRTQQSSRDT